LHKAVQSVEAEREQVSPLKTHEIAGMLNKVAPLKQLYLKQSSKPLEKHLRMSIEERQKMARERLLQT